MGDPVDGDHSIVRHNLMTRAGYSPYCGAFQCPLVPRTKFDGEQFVCPQCRWRSAFSTDFIAQYKAKWGAPQEGNDNG